MNNVYDVINNQLIQIGIEPNTVYFEIADRYYLENNILPNLDQVLNIYFDTIDNATLDNQQDNMPPLLDTQSNSNDYDEDNSNDDDEDNSNDDNYSDSVDNNDNNDDYDDDNNNDSNNNQTNDHHTNLTTNQIFAFTLRQNMPTVTTTENLINNFLSFIRRDDNAHLESFFSENSALNDVKSVLEIDEINKIELCYVRNNDNICGNQCQNCYDDFMEHELVRKLKCNHLFHRSCIDPQLNTISHLCPLCKVAVGKHVFL